MSNDIYKWWALAVVQLSILLVGVDSTITNLALPDITKSFEVNVTTSEWVISIFFIAVALALPAAGRFSDIFGRRSVFVSGFALFTVASALCGLAPNIYVLIFMRAIQGFGGAALLANSNVISLAVFPLKQHGLALGINGTVYSIGYALGFTLGGQLIHSFGWRSIFYLNVPTGLLAICLGLFILDESLLQAQANNNSHNFSFDIQGFIFSAIGIGGTMAAVVMLTSAKSFSYPLLSLLILGIISLFLFVFVELRNKSPLLDVKLFKIIEFSRGALTRLLNNAIVASCTFAIPFFTQTVLKFTAFQSGLIMLPYALGLAIVGPISGRLSDRYGPRWLTTLGFISGGVSLIWLNSIGGSTHSSVHVSPMIFKTIIAMFLLGSASGLFVSPNNSASLDAVPLNRTGTASGVIWSVSFIGSAFGTAYGAAILHNVLSGDVSSMNYLRVQSFLFQTLIILSFVGAFLCYTRSKSSKKLA
ncbi:MFS transporter [Cyanobium sp. HWJ4-Hawea]|uniref:MFS transporter n=1 Tax=Cyanobium sp. HWJ4-Hawea TaxID=2823713 RepID=UPI0020CF69D6|nr:MFS transporter [Cyanobium sp. HWJ4-Hawea]MCP9810059.1 MFS transporter [Cyanobium sp. HWJ4-Hawea]